MRIDRPRIIRGPASDELDSFFNEIRLANGLKRGFTANASTYAMDGKEPWDMGGVRRKVLEPGSPGTYNECGHWLSDTVKLGGVVHGFVHAESDCNYLEGRTHKSMAFATSSNEGLTWSLKGQIITGTDAPAPSIHTGEGDCTVIHGADGYYYAYCLRARDWVTIVARAPVANPAPGKWFKYDGTSWSQPGLGGEASSLGALGSAAAHWVTQDQILLLGQDKWFGGLKASFSSDKLQFTTMNEPWLFLDDDEWNRPAPTELIAYASVLSHDQVNNEIRNPFILTYTYVPPGEKFDRRYLVFRDVSIWMSSSPASPQVGVALSRWYNAATQDRWSTTAAVPGNDETYVYEGLLGYLMTKPHPTLATVKLEDCVSDWPGHPDHLLAECEAEGYSRLRTAGWIFEAPQPNTLPLYRCYNPEVRQHFVSNQANCEGMGSKEWLMGHALAR
ncbi:hypothetical protein ACN28I_40355 [Archangium gephyra]|uniref:hypothetical protein n=1 Tax=Archangium gephyra TaxID=48 RepID=UPI003B7B2D53